MCFSVNIFRSRNKIKHLDYKYDIIEHSQRNTSSVSILVLPQLKRIVEITNFVRKSVIT